MANSPVTPDNVKATIASTTSSVCGNMISALLRFPVLIYQLIVWLLNSDGSVSDEFKRQIIKPGDLIFSAAPLAPDTSRILADGSTVSRATYATLFAAIGVTYGAGDNSTTFVLPNYKDRFPVGAGITHSLGSTGGEDEHILSTAEMPGHRHTYGIDPLINDSSCYITFGNSEKFATDTNVDSGTFSGTSEAHTSAEGGDGSATLPTLSPAAAHNNLPPFIGAYIYLKT